MRFPLPEQAETAELPPRVAQVCRHARNKAMAYVAYIAVMLAAVCGLLVIGNNEYTAQLNRIEGKGTEVRSRTEILVASANDHVAMLRHDAEALLSETSASYAARRLFATIASSHEFDGYALDTMPRGVDPRTIGNLSGAGPMPAIESKAGREILMALALNPLLKATRDQIPDAAWVYYISAQRFVALQPWVPSSELGWSADLLDHEFYRLGTPAENPRRRPFWTDIYLDLGGRGLMMTAGQPVYDKNDHFRGTINIDLTMSAFGHYMSDEDFGGNRVLLVTDRDQVIADSANGRRVPTAVDDLAGLLPQSPALLAAASAPGAQGGTFRPAGAWLVQSTAIGGAPWRLLIIVDRSSLIFSVLRSVWIGFIGLALLAFALVAVEQRRRAGAALAANVKTLRAMTMNLAAARDEARQANQAKSMLLANVSHELRTPLNAIIGFSDMMRHQVFGPLGDQKYKGYADDIQHSGKLLLDLINDLLDVTRLESGHHDLLETDCDLAAILHEAANLVQVQAERADVAVKVRVTELMPSLRADERALRQIVLNLLSNAIKFTPAKGQVRLSCAVNADGKPVITVEDTGRGIAPEDIKELFRPFARTAEAKRASTPGTGLGLALVKGLVELHQGTVELESRLGLGTTVTVTLPAARIIARRVQGAA